MSRCLGDRVKRWITHNEPWCASMVACEKGAHAPGLRDGGVALQASHHLLLSHGMAVPVLRANSRGLRGRHHAQPLARLRRVEQRRPTSTPSAGTTATSTARFSTPSFEASTRPTWCVTTARAEFWPTGSASFVRPGDLRTIAAPTDFLGVNYYNRAVVRTDPDAGRDNLARCAHVPQPGPRTDIGWEVYADGMFETLTRVHRDYRPAKIYITENGASYGDGPDARGRIDDARRIAFLRDHLKATHRAMSAGVPVSGYFAWSLMDNFEWSHGYQERFGMTWVDYATQKRTPKESAHWYRGVIAENAVD